MLKNKHFFKRRYRSNKGFTLIEVLVAIAIFASLSVSAYMVLAQVQRSNQISIEKSERLKAIQRAMVIIDNDFRQIALRQFRTNGEDASDQIIVWGEGVINSEDKGLMFTRLGWQNPQQMFPRGEVTKVGYRVIEGTLERVWWRYPDTAVSDEGVVTPLLEDVEKIEVKFYRKEGWSETWQQSLTLPKAIAFIVHLKDYGEIERVYLTAGDKLNSLASDGGNDD